MTNRGAHLPPLPPRFRQVMVDLPCPVIPGPERSKEERYNVIRDDKGARVWAGLQSVEPSGHVMVVDYDDLVSRRLASFAAKAPEAAGWYISDGYLFDGSSLLERRSEFDELCGSSLIVHSRHFYPANADNERMFVRYIYGSHKFIKTKLANLGDPLVALPFPGAMYRVGHAHATSGSQGVRQRLAFISILRRPRQSLERLRNMAYLNSSLRREFLAG